MDKAYAYKNSKEIRRQSSSGGAFYGICRSFINFVGEGVSWSIYGAKFDDQFRVIHERATTLQECLPFCGSKYVQSNVGNCPQQVAEDLRNGYAVLFTGTPCQIGAVKAYLAKNGCPEERLYTMDIVCHGTPQPQFWQDYVNYLEEKNQSKLVRFSFRYKKKGWKGYPIYAEFENGKRCENTFAVSIYMNLFRKDLLMRKNCFHCPYPGKFQSDITAGDFWGIELCMPEVPTDGGVSLLLVHTQKGMDLTEGMQSEDILLKPVPGERYLQYNRNLRDHTPAPAKYDAFWTDYKNKGMKYVLDQYGENHLRGRGKFYLKRFLRASGMLTLVKKLLKRA